MTFSGVFYYINRKSAIFLVPAYFNLMTLNTGIIFTKFEVNQLIRF